jgi:hypothetical protein
MAAADDCPLTWELWRLIVLGCVGELVYFKPAAARVFADVHVLESIHQH